MLIILKFILMLMFISLAIWGLFETSVTNGDKAFFSIMILFGIFCLFKYCIVM